LTYAFIVNRQLLLFCFQAPAAEFEKHDFDELQALFTDVKQNGSSEPP
jgi:hypothetical protein